MVGIFVASEILGDMKFFDHREFSRTVLEELFENIK